MEMDRLWSMPVRTKSETVDVWAVVSKGYRAGEFYNPVYAAYITGMVRVQLNKACAMIEARGGTPLLTMTDSIFWKGSPDLLPEDMWREKKTLGYFEKPETATDFICLGSGRYGYVNQQGYQQTKRRGINVRNFKDADGIALDDFNWMELARTAAKHESATVDLDVSVLISPGLVRASNELSINDLGRVVIRPRTLGLTVGHTKRIAEVERLTGDVLMTEMIMSKPLHLDRFMTGDLIDGTYPTLRYMMNSMELVTRDDRKRVKGAKRSRKHYQAHAKERYRALVEAGFTADEARSLRNASDDDIRRHIQTKGDQS